ncbi:hypothetical protein NQ315_010955 [Exocentrus adspersus]|uniref:THAP-type domain-containing protein n=1 Tax=Exocentrus adspersus TaxID=1586481 RepID=A0AAV8VGD5_9CUCU|nr:hypothetical protein NQ315_010955 [Exocentrus adspersus]
MPMKIKYTCKLSYLVGEGMKLVRKRHGDKYCVVPECRNTSRYAPEKLFISVPFDPVTRKVWQKAMRRDVFVSDKSHVHCCEDHFNPKVVPRFFDCQKNRVTTHRSKSSSRFLQKREQQSLINNLLCPETSEASMENEDIEQGHEMEIEPKSKDMDVQVKVRTKGVQCIREDLPFSNIEKKRKCPFKERAPKKMRLEIRDNKIKWISSFAPCAPTLIFSQGDIIYAGNDKAKRYTFPDIISRTTV